MCGAPVYRGAGGGKQPAARLLVPTSLVSSRQVTPRVAGRRAAQAAAVSRPWRALTLLPPRSPPTQGVGPAGQPDGPRHRRRLRGAQPRQADGAGVHARVRCAGAAPPGCAPTDACRQRPAAAGHARGAGWRQARAAWARPGSTRACGSSRWGRPRGGATEGWGETAGGGHGWHGGAGSGRVPGTAGQAAPRLAERWRGRAERG